VSPGRRLVSPALRRDGPAFWRFGCVFVTAVPIIKLFAWGEGDSGGHVLRETTSQGLCGLACPSRTSERGGEGDCVKEGGGGEGERERERALGLLLRHSPGYRD
jgi:hypothetical protein